MEIFPLIVETQTQKEQTIRWELGLHMVGYKQKGFPQLGAESHNREYIILGAVVALFFKLLCGRLGHNKISQRRLDTPITNDVTDRADLSIANQILLP